MLQKRNQKTLLFLIIILLITNFSLLYLLLNPAEKPKEPELTRSERMVKMVQNELSLTPSQLEAYIILRQKRDSILKPLQQELRIAKFEMLQMLQKDSLSDEQVKAAADKVGSVQPAIEMAYFNHFRRIQAMLATEQQPKFDTLLQRMIYRNTGVTDSLRRVNEAGN